VKVRGPDAVRCLRGQTAAARILLNGHGDVAVSNRN
jgi:hypothetical protein